MGLEGVHRICERYVDEYAVADPVMASMFGIGGQQGRLTDYSPVGHGVRAEIARRALRAVQDTEPADEAERVAKAVFCERVGLEVEIHEAGLPPASLNVTSSPVQDIRMVFDLMDTESADDWAVVATRLAKVPEALDSVRASLLFAAGHGRISAVRQLEKTADQAETWAGRDGKDGFFTTFVAAAESVDGAPMGELRRAARTAEQAYGDFARFLRVDLAPRAPVRDAVGEDVYRLWSRYHIGAELDLREAYAWGWDEFRRIESEMLTVAGRIKPGATLAETAAALDADPRYQVRGQAAFEAWMQRLSDAALESLRGKHFDIPDQLMTLECRIAPPGGGVGAYYTGPSEDFARPGRMWWSVPADRQDFATWRELTTVYHEGVPGHHLQIATAVHEAAALNKYQRMMSFTSGHGEGWALYAERLMRELGYLDDDGNLLGMLAEQLFRTARVIVDIGMHLELEIPSNTAFHEHERWTPALGLEFLLTRTITDPVHVHDEIDRYLGWPGQAPAYKLGERLWLSARDDARTRAGNSFNLKDFHTRALKLGGMGLDTLRAELG